MYTIQLPVSSAMSRIANLYLRIKFQRMRSGFGFFSLLKPYKSF